MAKENETSLDWTGSEMDSSDRAHMAANLDAADIITKAKDRKVTPVSYLQRLFPEREHELEPVCAAESILERRGVRILGNKQRGIRASSMNQIWKDDNVGRLWAACVKEMMLNRHMGREDLTNLDFSISDYEPGSAMRQYAVADLAQSNPITSFPPLSQVVGSVQIQDSDVLQMPQLTRKDNPEGQSTSKWNEGDEPNLPRLTVKESKADSEFLQGGLEMTRSLRNSDVGSDAVIMQLDQQRVDGERVLVNETLVAIDEGLSDTASGLTASGDIDAEAVADIAMAFSGEQDFLVTTLVGLQDIVKRYLLADRTGFFHYGGPRNASQSFGSDVYGKASMDRLVYDLPASRLPAGVTAGKLLGWDNRVTADVFMAAGSEENIDEYNGPTGIYLLVWRFKYGITLRTPEESLSRKRFA